MRNLSLLISLSFLLPLIVGCGADEAASSEVQQTPPPASKSTAKAKNENASASEVAAAARGEVSCPVVNRSPSRQAEAPTDDIQGVRPGMTYAEAQNAVLCSDEMLVTKEEKRGFQLQTFGQTVRQGFSADYAKARVQKSGQEIMKEMQDNAMARSMNKASSENMAGQNRWFVGTMGLPGEEQVIHVAREEWFAEQRNPTLDSVEQALLEKYGTPSDKKDQGSDRFYTWAYDPYDRLITETSPLFHQCRVESSPSAGINLTPDCGVVVSARSRALRDNPLLTEAITVAVVAMGQGYELLQSTEAGLLEQENQRRTQQVEAANQNADKPKL
jgi:hypothetical protein